MIFHAQKILNNLSLSTHNSHIAVLSPITEYYSPDLYTYKLNSHWFRSIEFSSDIEILAVGCSNTVGVGLPVEHTWPQLLSQMNGNAKVGTLAQAGASIQRLVYDVFKYIKMYGKPKVIICNFPDFYRYEYINKDTFARTLEDPAYGDYKHPGLTDYYTMHINLQSIMTLEQMCGNAGIKLAWTTWAYKKDVTCFNDASFISLLEESFSNFFPDQMVDSFKNFHEIAHFDKDQNVIVNGVKYSAECCHDFEQETKDYFHLAYDRYNVPKKYQSADEQIRLSKEEIDTLKKMTLNTRPYICHFGAHRHLHWAKFFSGLL